MKKILILNGPNLSKLGRREPTIYGEISMDVQLSAWREKFSWLQIEYLQSEQEAVLLEALLNESFDAVVLNAGAYAHTSLAMRDAIAALPRKVVEVHISNVYARESFRHFSNLSAVCSGSISGFGLDSYELALQWLAQSK
jgi:3-dehydroquinate dehydratase II